MHAVYELEKNGWVWPCGRHNWNGMYVKCQDSHSTGRFIAHDVSFFGRLRVRPDTVSSARARLVRLMFVKAYTQLEFKYSILNSIEKTNLAYRVRALRVSPTIIHIFKIKIIKKNEI